MIARIWTARTTRAHFPAYAEYLRTHVFAGLRDIAGYERAMLLQREAAEGVEVQVITFWQSLEAIEAFAGSDVESAVVTETAQTLLTTFDRRARHFSVALEDTPAGGTRGDAA